MKRRVEAHFGFIVGLMAQHKACRGNTYFTPGGQSYPQADSDFPNIATGLSASLIVNQLIILGQKRRSPLDIPPVMTNPSICRVSN